MRFGFYPWSQANEGLIPKVKEPEEGQGKGWSLLGSRGQSRKGDMSEGKLSSYGRMAHTHGATEGWGSELERRHRPPGK